MKRVIDVLWEAIDHYSPLGFDPDSDSDPDSESFIIR